MQLKIKQVLIFFFVFVLILHLTLGYDSLHDFYVDSEDIRTGHSGGACSATSGDPDPEIFDETISTNCPYYFADCGWNGATCTYESNNITIWLNQTLRFKPNSLKIYTSSCTYYGWKSYCIQNRINNQWNDVICNTDAMDECIDDTNDYQTLTHPTFDASLFRFIVKDTNGSGTSKGVYITEIELVQNATLVDGTLPEFNISVDYSTDCLDNNTVDFDIEFYANDAENEVIYFDYVCDYKTNYTYLINLWSDNYNLYKDGFNNGSCDYGIEEIDSVVNNALFLNTSACVSDLRKRIALQDDYFVFESMQNVYDSDTLITEFLTDDYNTAFSVSFNITDNLLYINVYNGSDYLNYNTHEYYDNVFWKIYFDFYTNEVIVSYSLNFRDSYITLDDFNFVSNHNNISFINFIPEVYTYYPSWISTTWITNQYYPNTWTSYGNPTNLTCTYDKLGMKQFRIYVNDISFENLTSNYEDLFLTVSTLCKPNLTSSTDNLKDNFIKNIGNQFFGKLLKELNIEDMSHQIVWYLFLFMLIISLIKTGDLRVSLLMTSFINFWIGVFGFGSTGFVITQTLFFTFGLALTLIQ